MAVKFSPFGNQQLETSLGVPAVGTLLYTYAAGSSTPLATYTSSTGLIAQTNPVVIDSNGLPTGGEIWLTQGLTYKFVWKTAAGVEIRSIDNISGVNDASISVSQWVASGLTPTYVSATSFTLAGDQTTEFHVGRRLQFTVSAGTVYGTITATVFGALTTVTVVMDAAQALDVGLSAVNLSILRGDRTALPFMVSNTVGYSLLGPINDARTTVASHATTADIWSAGNVINWTGTAATTSFPAAPQAGASRRLHIASTGGSFAPSATIDIIGNTTFYPVAGDSIDVEAITTTTFRLIPIKEDGAPFFTTMRGHLAGLTLSTAGSSATMSIAAGQAQDSTNVASMVLSAFSKTTSAWALGTGNGGLDTGAIANATWYHFYLIRRVDTGVVDVVFSTSASSPTLPTNYTQYRRIGSGLTNGSAQWVLFTQNGNEFLWDVAVIDVDAANPGASAVTRTLTVPTGIAVDAVLYAGGYYASSAFTFLLSPLSVSDQAPQAIATASLTGFSSNTSQNSVAGWNFAPINVRTNTSGQIRSRLSTSGASDRLGIITRGWIDTRGRDV